MKDELEKNRKVFRTLGDTPKIITTQDDNGIQISLHQTGLFPPQMLVEPNIKMG